MILLKLEGEIQIRNNKLNYQIINKIRKHICRYMICERMMILGYETERENYEIKSM